MYPSAVLTQDDRDQLLVSMKRFAEAESGGTVPMEFEIGKGNVAGISTKRSRSTTLRNGRDCSSRSGRTAAAIRSITARAIWSRPVRSDGFCGRGAATAATIRKASGTTRSIRRRTSRTVDWKTWLGPAPSLPWSAERYFRWRKYWDYGTGIIGDLWPHRLHPLMLALGLNEFPSSVSCIGGDLCATDSQHGADGQPNGAVRDVADTTLMMVEFPCGSMIVLAGSTVNERGIEDIIRGQKANLTLGGGRLAIAPERPFADELDARDETPPDAWEQESDLAMQSGETSRNRRIGA
jgi:hypothetical protein